MKTQVKLLDAVALARSHPQREVVFFSPDSASAIAPCAATGAIGKGSFSTSEVRRKKK